MKKFDESDIFVSKIKAHPKVKLFSYNGKIYHNNSTDESIILNSFLPTPSSSVVLPSIVEDGLVVHLDAGNTDSYSGTGPTWYDLTSNNADFNLENSPTFNTGSEGYFQLNGSDQAAAISLSTTGVTDFDNTDDYTIEAWFNASSSQPDVTTNYVAIVEKWNSSGGTQYPYALRYHVTNGNFMFQTYDKTNSAIAYASEVTDQWVQCVGVYDWTNTTLYFYVNGELSTHPWGGTDDLSVVTNTVSNTLGTAIGRRISPTYGFHLNGGVAIFRIYNKALSDTEVLQNYNANKDRFGL